MATDTLSNVVIAPVEVPTHWYNLAAELPTPPPPHLHPGHQGAGPAVRPGGAVPGGADRSGGLDRGLHRDPRADPGDLSHLASVAAHPGDPLRAGAEHQGADLLQVRGRQPGRQPQDEFGGRPGVLQPCGRRDQADHRDRRRPVGERAGVRLRDVRHRTGDLAGTGVVRLQALPAAPDERLRRHGALQPVGPHRVGSGGARRASRHQRQSRYRGQRGGRGGGQGSEGPVRAGQRAQSRAAAPDRDRPGGGRNNSGWPERTGRIWSSAVPAAGRTSPGCRSPSCAMSWPGPPRPG